MKGKINWNESMKNIFEDSKKRKKEFFSFLISGMRSYYLHDSECH